MKKTGILVGAAPLGSERALLEEMIHQNNVYTVAVDGGITFFLEVRQKPDHWLGDMDSAAEKNVDRPDCRTTKFPPEKDDTDMALAVKIALEEDCTEIVIFGGTGGKRMAHTFANIQLLHHYARLGRKISMISERNKMMVLCDGRYQFTGKEKGFISVFSLTDHAENVSIRNFKYEYEGSLTNENALGVSNEFCGKPGIISVEKGALLLVFDY